MSMFTFATLSAVLIALSAVEAQFTGFAPPQARQHIPVVARSEQRNHDGSFSQKYQGGDGQVVEQTGIARPNHEGDGHVIVTQGSYKFTSPEGQSFTVTYTADENGFHPVASHLPQPVPAPVVRF